MATEYTLRNAVCIEDRQPLLYTRTSYRPMFGLITRWARIDASETLRLEKGFKKPADYKETVG